MVVFCVRRAIIKKQDYAFQKGTDMNRNNFTELFKAIREESLGKNQNSTVDLDDAYDTDEEKLETEEEQAEAESTVTEEQAGA